MAWSADIVTEPTKGHRLCVDLFEGGVHRARLQRDTGGEPELVCYGGEFSIPADWLMGVVRRFIAETGVALGNA